MAIHPFINIHTKIGPDGRRHFYILAEKDYPHGGPYEQIGPAVLSGLLHYKEHLTTYPFTAFVQVDRHTSISFDEYSEFSGCGLATIDQVGDVFQLEYFDTSTAIAESMRKDTYLNVGDAFEKFIEDLLDAAWDARRQSIFTLHLKDKKYSITLTPLYAPNLPVD